MSITQLSATALAQAIAAGELRAEDAVAAHIERIEALNPRLNAVAARRYKTALAEARAADHQRGARGLLHGVPITIKDSIDVAGLPSTFGLPSRAAQRAAADDVHVARLRAAGAIVLAKTNVAQCLAYTECDNPLHGRTLNPWDAARTPGGSSGGEAALIAAGGSPLGLGTDIGGSVRVPAAFCGIASLKPTSGRLDDPGEYSWPAGQRAVPSQVGVMARHSEDVALGLRVANGDRGDVPPLWDYRKVDLSTLKVAYYTADGSFEPSPAAQRAVLQATEALRSAGARVQAWAPPAVPEMLAVFGGLLTADGGAHLRRVLRGNPVTPQLKQILFGAGLPAWLLPGLRALVRALGQSGLEASLAAFARPTADRHFTLVQRQQRYRDTFAEALGDCDLVLAPPVSLPAFTHGSSRDLLTAGAYAPLYNLLGWPAGVVPVTRVRSGEESRRRPGRDLIQRLAARVEQGSAGLPMGVQVIARPWQEHLVLAAMQAIEQAARAQDDFPQTPVEPAPQPGA